MFLKNDPHSRASLRNDVKGFKEPKHNLLFLLGITHSQMPFKEYSLDVTLSRKFIASLPYKLCMNSNQECHFSKLKTQPKPVILSPNSHPNVL